MGYVNVCGHFFTDEWYKFLMNNFKKNFSIASLSIENSLEKLNEYDFFLEKIRNKEKINYYQSLDDSEKLEIDNFLKYSVVCRAHQFGILSGAFDVDASQDIIDTIFQDNFSYMLDDLHYIVCFTNDGKLNKKDTFMNMRDIFRISFERKVLYDEVKGLQDDYIEAYDYALSLKKIGILDIIKINEIVNQSDANREIGFKKTDNIITGANFSVTSKENVPVQMQELLADYQNNFGFEIFNYNDSNISSDERYKRILSLFEKEAFFHIKMIRIHPFQDGNGRTTRIIMNKHLIDEGFAPVLITNNMLEDYKSYIASYDYKSLAKMMLDSSLQLLSSWVMTVKNNDNVEASIVK